MSDPLALADVADLERRVGRALATGDPAGLDVIGWGEISIVLRVETAAGPVVAKRLPVFDSFERLGRYVATFGDYLAALEDRGVSTVRSELRFVERDDRTYAAYCLQPLCDPATLGVNALGAADELRAREILGWVSDALVGAVGPDLGVDGQISNWVVEEGRVVYLDVTTPLCRDAAGLERLDTGVFLASLPWALRGPVRHFALGGIVDKYYSPRGVLCDLAANFYKEGLERWIPLCLDVVNAQLSQPLTVADLERYYAEDARLWEVLQRLRRADRWWQRSIRRRAYPFLLPGQIAR